MRYKCETDDDHAPEGQYRTVAGDRLDMSPIRDVKLRVLQSHITRADYASRGRVTLNPGQANGGSTGDIGNRSLPYKSKKSTCGKWIWAVRYASWGGSKKVSNFIANRIMWNRIRCQTIARRGSDAPVLR